MTAIKRSICTVALAVTVVGTVLITTEANAMMFGGRGLGHFASRGHGLGHSMLGGGRFSGVGRGAMHGGSGIDPGGPVIADDANKAKAACTWQGVGVTIHGYGDDVDKKGRKTTTQKLKDAAVDLAKAFVKEFGTKFQNGIVKTAVEGA